MRTLPACALLFVSMLSCLALADQDWLADYAWKNRHILVFAPAHDDARLRSLDNDMQRASDAVKDRKLLLWEIIASNSVSLQGTQHPSEASAWRQRYDVAATDFALLLVGYDGEVKLRLDQPDLERVLGEIDLMPIRRMEMQQSR